MEEAIDNINKYLEWPYVFWIPNNFKEGDFQSFLEKDPRIFPLGDFYITKDAFKLQKRINLKVFQPMLINAVRGNSPYPLKKYTNVQLRIALCMIDKSDMDEKDKLKWFDHLLKTNEARLSACMQYYIDKILPF